MMTVSLLSGAHRKKLFDGGTLENGKAIEKPIERSDEVLDLAISTESSVIVSGYWDRSIIP